MGQINVIDTPIKGVQIIEPIVWDRDHDYFMETYNLHDMHMAGIDAMFVQDNQSKSSRGVLRGLHTQRKHPQGKLVRVIKGAVFDVAVDLRVESSTYGQWFGIELSESNKKQLYIPERFAHGFYVISDVAEFCFKTTDYWHADDELGIAWNDPGFAIDWPIPTGTMPILAEKDRHYPPFVGLKQ